MQRWQGVRPTGRRAMPACLLRRHSSPQAAPTQLRRDANPCPSPSTAIRRWTATARCQRPLDYPVDPENIGQPKCISLEFTREAESLQDARNSATIDVKRAIPSATLLDDGGQMNDFQVPDDFPRPQHWGTVPGAQTKFLAVEYLGRFYPPDGTSPELNERWRHSMSLVEQSCRRELKPKLASARTCRRPTYSTSTWCASSTRNGSATTKHAG